jgi:branched-chain amino acid transport system permease protein
MRWWAVRLVSIAATLAVLFVTSRLVHANVEDYPVRVMVLCGIFVILAVSLNLVNGITGQFSIGHGGFYGVGAYTAAAWSV